MTSCRGRIFAVGGTDNWNCLNSVEYYDPKKNVWELFTPLSIARRGSGVAFYNGNSKKCSFLFFLET